MSNHIATNEFTVRLARTSDARQLAALASLDSAPPLQGEVVVAESEGRIVAAKPLAGGRAIADPFMRTAALVQMLDLRAEQLGATTPARKAGMIDRLRVLHERPAVRVN